MTDRNGHVNSLIKSEVASMKSQFLDLNQKLNRCQERVDAISNQVTDSHNEITRLVGMMNQTAALVKPGNSEDAAWRLAVGDLSLTMRRELQDKVRYLRSNYFLIKFFFM